MCYKKFDNKISFLDAERHCQTEGGNLARISSYEENALVGNIGGSGYFWIGLWSGNEGKCSRDKNSWVWTDGTAGTGFSRWGNAASGQKWNPPDCHVGLSKGMAVFFNYPHRNNRWEDGEIATARPFVCGISEEKLGKCVALNYMEVT